MITNRYLLFFELRFGLLNHQSNVSDREDALCGLLGSSSSSSASRSVSHDDIACPVGDCNGGDMAPPNPTPAAAACAAPNPNPNPVAPGDCGGC